MARHATGNQLERIVRSPGREIRDRRLADKAARRRPPTGAAADRAVQPVQRATANCASPSKPAPPTAAVLLAAIEAARTDLSAERSDEPAPHLPASSTAGPTAAAHGKSKLTVHSPRSGWSRLPDGELLPPGCLQLTIHDQGRSHVTPAKRSVTSVRSTANAALLHPAQRCRPPRLLLSRHHETVIHTQPASTSSSRPRNPGP